MPPPPSLLPHFSRMPRRRPLDDHSLLQRQHPIHAPRQLQIVRGDERGQAGAADDVDERRGASPPTRVMRAPISACRQGGAVYSPTLILRSAGRGRARRSRALPDAGLAPLPTDERRPAFLRWMAYVPSAIYGPAWLRGDPMRLVSDERRPSYRSTARSTAC